MIVQRDLRHISMGDIRLALNEVILTKISASEACMANIIRRWWLSISPRHTNNNNSLYHGENLLPE